jgi:hypothetical protein
MAQRPTPEELQNNKEFELIDAFHIDEMGTFLARENECRNRYQHR